MAVRSSTSDSAMLREISSLGSQAGLPMRQQLECGLRTKSKKSEYSHVRRPLTTWRTRPTPTQRGPAAEFLSRLASSPLNNVAVERGTQLNAVEPPQAVYAGRRGDRPPLWLAVTCLRYLPLGRAPRSLSLWSVHQMSRNSSGLIPLVSELNGAILRRCHSSDSEQWSSRFHTVSLTRAQTALLRN